MYFSSNIKFLRKRKGRTQEDVASSLGLKRPTLNNYENKVALPGMEKLLSISEYFGVAIDTLVKVDLRELSESQLSQLERGYDVFIRGSKLRVLATTVDNSNNENIELVSEKAKAGYSNGFADPEYIRVLPTFRLPFLSRDRKYRTFQIKGDSMLPIPDGAWITGEYVQNWNDIRNQQAYIILTLNEGILFKVVENLMEEKGFLKLHSLNPIYVPYSIHVNEIREVWKFVHYISQELPETRPAENEIMENIREIKKDVTQINKKLNRLPEK